MKTCKKCLVTKDVLDFHPNARGPMKATCIACVNLTKKIYWSRPEMKEVKKKYGEKWRAENKEKLRVSKKVYAQKNRDRIKKYKFNYHVGNREAAAEKGKRYYAENKELRREQGITYRRNNKEVIQQRQHKYRQNNKEVIQQRQHKYRQNNRQVVLGRINHKNNLRYKTDVQFRLRTSLRTRTNRATKGIQKAGSAIRDLGCTVGFLKEYLESQFTEVMNWDNQGRGIGRWHLDHIMPLTAFDLEDRQHFLLASHYGNLRPMWMADNVRKGDQIPDVNRLAA